MRKKYYGYWSNSNGSCIRDPYVDTNKAKLVKTMRSIARGNVPSGGSCSWSIYNSREEEHYANEYLIAAGTEGR